MHAIHVQNNQLELLKNDRPPKKNSNYANESHRSPSTNCQIATEGKPTSIENNESHADKNFQHSRKFISNTNATSLSDVRNNGSNHSGYRNNEMRSSRHRKRLGNEKDELNFQSNCRPVDQRLSHSQAGHYRLASPTDNVIFIVTFISLTITK